MGFGMLCRVPNAKEFLMGWNKIVANEYSELMLGWKNELKKLFISVLKPQLNLGGLQVGRDKTNRLNVGLWIVILRNPAPSHPQLLRMEKTLPGQYIWRDVTCSSKHWLQ